MDEKQFPIIHTLGPRKKEFIPWSAIEHCEARAMKNHGQTLTRLAERGGLSWCEALAVLEDRKRSSIDTDVARQKVLQIVSNVIKCVKCGTGLKLGKFAYNQNICWNCFKKEIIDICDGHAIQITDREPIYHAMKIVAEIFGCEF